MSNKLKLEKILNELDYRDVIPDQPFGKAKDMNRLKTKAVTGDQAAHHAARAEVTIDRIKDNLRSMGVNASSLDDQDTIDYYKALKTFPFSFSLNEPIEGYFDGNNKGIRGKATVDKDSNEKNFIIYFIVTEDVDTEEDTYKKEEKSYKIQFSPKTLYKNLSGTDISLPMLLEGKIYDVRISEGGPKIGDVSSDDSKNDSKNDEGKSEERVGDGSDNEEKGKEKDGNEVDGDEKEKGGNIQYVKVKKEDLKKLNSNSNKLKNSANNIKSLKLTKFSDNKNFRDALLLNLIRSKVTSIKINGKPISVTLKKLKDNGLLEAPKSRDINKKKQLPQDWENQLSSFFEDVFQMFALLNKCCKDNQTYIQIKKFFKLLYLIVKESQANYSDKEKRQQLFKKLIRTINNFASALSKTNLEFSNKTKSEGTNVLLNLVNEIVSESILKEDEEGGSYFDRKLKILSVPNFAYEKDDDEKYSTKGGKKSGGVTVPKGEALADSISKISNIRGTGASTWSSDNIQAVLNNEFKSDRVLVKKSISKKDTLVLYYPGIQQKLGTDAILISADNISNLFLGKRLKNYTVKIGPKVAGKEEFKQEGEAEITLLPS